MKLLGVLSLCSLALAAIACGSNHEEPAPASSESAQITDVLTMTRRSDGDFDVVCTNGTRLVATPAQILANQVCGGGNPPPASPILGRVFGRSDSCGGDPVVTVRAETDCFALSDRDAAWSVFQNGQCKDISDTNVRAACLTLNTAGKAVFGRSDSCGGTPIARVDANTDCFALSDRDAAWSIWENGQCKDISDTNARAACLSLQPTGKAIFGRSDSCGGDPIAKITPGFDCFTLPDSGSAWSVFADGQCKDISDTTPRGACLALEPN